MGLREHGTAVDGYRRRGYHTDRPGSLLPLVDEMEMVRWSVHRRRRRQHHRRPSHDEVWEACEVCEPTKRRRAGPGRRECMIREDVLSSERSVPFDERDGECEWDCIVG
jgi:hypothetical protein